MTFDAFDVVIVAFPFTDRNATKCRPALVLSLQETFNQESGHLVLAMITSARHSAWPLDVRITDLTSAGLPAPSIVRMKLFTLDQRLILRAAGRLGESDRVATAEALEKLFLVTP